MFNIFQKIIARFKQANEKAEVIEENKEQAFLSPNWQQERFSVISSQRNILFFLLVFFLSVTISAIFALVYIAESKTFDPFVIQIDETTGSAMVVNPVSSNVLSANDSLAKYFVKKYVTARETYSPVDFKDLARKTIRLCSTSSIYWNYLGYLRNNEVNPEVKYANKNTTYLTVRSWSKLADNKYILRFAINETSGSLQVFNKIAIVEFQYVPMELSEQDRDVNPVGFQVTAYRVDDDKS